MWFTRRTTIFAARARFRLAKAVSRSSLALPPHKVAPPNTGSLINFRPFRRAKARAGGQEGKAGGEDAVSGFAGRVMEQLALRVSAAAPGGLAPLGADPRLARHAPAMRPISSSFALRKSDWLVEMNFLSNATRQKQRRTSTLRLMRSSAGTLSALGRKRGAAQGVWGVMAGSLSSVRLWKNLLTTTSHHGKSTGMTATIIRQKQQAQPFKPFDLLLPGAKRVRVPHPDYIFVSPSGRFAEVWDVDDNITTLDVRRILGVEEKRGTRRSAK